MRVAAVAALALIWACELPLPPPQATAAAPAPAAPAPAVTPASAPIPLPAALPRLLDTGFEGLSAMDMASETAVQHAFAALEVSTFQSQLDVFDGRYPYAATIYFDAERGGYEVAIQQAGITTEHGLEVGRPFADVLKIPARHACEAYTVPRPVGPTYDAVRCWVGKKPAHFEYVTFIHDSDVHPPRSSKALDRWIARTDRKIAMVYWTRNPDHDR